MVGSQSRSESGEVASTDLIPGEKYLLSFPPFGLEVVRYLGPSFFWPGRVRVQHAVFRFKLSVPRAALRPALALIEGGR